MATINLGKIKPLYKGTYSAGVTYRPLDFVLYNTALYICKQQATGVLPSTTAYFDPVAPSAAGGIANTPAGTITAVTVQDALNQLDSSKAPKASAALTGIPTAPTAAAGVNTTQIATTAYALAAAALRYGKNNILGTVSQSAGVPTGAVIERGSNANGQYIRFAGGWQICFVHISIVGMTMFSLGSFGIKHGALSTLFPASFIEPPAVSGVGFDSDINGRGWIGGNDSTDTVLNCFYMTASPAATLNVSGWITAVGLWHL